MNRTKVLSRISVAIMVIGLLVIINLDQAVWARIVASLCWVAIVVSLHVIFWRLANPEK